MNQEECGEQSCWHNKTRSGLHVKHTSIRKSLLKGEEKSKRYEDEILLITLQHIRKVLKQLRDLHFFDSRLYSAFGF